MKKKQYSLESKEDWRITFEWGTEFITSLLILLRLVSLWALYTLKWTLVLMGHYLTYESLRHNQLPFTFKDHWVMATLSFLPLRPHASAKVSWRRGLRSPWLCDHPKSCGGPALQVVGKRGLSAALVQAPVPCHASWPCARLSKRVVQPAGMSRYLERQTAGGHLTLTHCTAKLFGPQRGFSNLGLYQSSQERKHA